MNTRLRLSFLLLLAALSVPPTIAAPSPPQARYVGRWDTRDSGGPRCQWPASSVQVRFRASALSVRLHESGHDFWQIVVDGQPTAVLELHDGDAVLPVATGLTNAPHTVALVKRTEAFVGTTQITGWLLPSGGRWLPPAAPPHPPLGNHRRLHHLRLRRRGAKVRKSTSPPTPRTLIQPTVPSPPGNSAPTAR